MPALIAYPDGPAMARTAPADVAALTGHGEVEVLVGWTVEQHPWLADRDLRGRTVLAGYALAGAVGEGRIVPLPIRLSAVPHLLEAHPPDVAVVTGVRRGDELVHTTSIGWAPAAARSARAVVVEIDEGADDPGTPVIEGAIVATVARPPAPPDPSAASRPADATDLRIGALVASLLPPEPTLQFGPGGMGEGIARALTRPVRLWSGLVTDAMAELAARDLLIGSATAAYAWGGEPVARLMRAGRLDLQPVTVTHDISALSAIPRFVGCNTALQVGLDGAVNVERIGPRVIAAIGGHADFCAGASRSPGGISIVAVRSTTGRGASTIVPHLDVVSTPHQDVDVVVTEHGIADLRGFGDAERAVRIIEVAHPDHRDRLRDALAARGG